METQFETQGQAEVPVTKWYSVDARAVVEELKSDGVQGLTQQEALRRLQQYGPNEILVGERVTAWSIFASQFKNILIVILIIAVALSILLGHMIEALAITVIMLFAVILGFLQEYRAERAIEALRKMAAPTATVIRDGHPTDLPAREIVPGDIILVRAGSRIPADGRLLEEFNLHVDEAALTGESVPVEKDTGILTDNGLAPGDQRNMIFAGTIATYGRGKAIVVATGMQTVFGKIAEMLETVETTKSPLQENLDRVGYILARAAFVVVLLIVALGFFRGQRLLDMIVFGIALAVAVVPEALPAVATISLAMGVQRMVRRNALIRHLPVVETLGSTSVICSDKTGTLTKDEMTVRRIVAGNQVIHVTGSGYDPIGNFLYNDSVIQPSEPLLMLLKAGALASDARLVQKDGIWQIKGDPTEGALVVAAMKAGIDKVELDKNLERIHEIPFTSERKRMTTLHQDPETGEIVAYSKGAAEVILDSCTHQQTNGGVAELTPSEKRRLLEEAKVLAKEGLRVLGLSTKKAAAIQDAEEEMVFLGLVGMIDPPRPEAKKAVKVAQEAGIKVVMITGDHPLTAEAVAREVGILSNGHVIVGSEVDSLSDEELERRANQIEVYARVSPAHKLRVITALQKNGHVVAMTGDGINDAPALKKADVGVAMGITGTDVTKEASAMTLTDDNFASIVAAVEEGRGIFGNIKKYLMYLLSSNLGEILLMAGASIFGLPLPLSPVQILYVNLATDGLPALALSVDPPEKDLMKQKPRNPRTGIFTRSVVTLMGVAGVWSAIVNLSLFTWALSTNRTLSHAMTMIFVSLVITEFFKAYNFRSDRNSVFHRTFSNRWLNLAILWELLLLNVILFMPALQKVFGTSQLSGSEWLLILILSGSVLPIVELVKWMLRRGWFTGEAATAPMIANQKETVDEHHSVSLRLET